MLSALTGVAVTLVSGCCGSREPASPTPVIVGLLVAACAVAAAAQLWCGGPAAGVLAAAAVPTAVTTGFAVRGHVDAATPALLLLVGFGLLVAGCRSPSWRAWQAGRRG